MRNQRVTMSDTNDGNHIEAAYNDGILTLTMPKKVEVKPASRKLEIK